MRRNEVEREGGGDGLDGSMGIGIGIGGYKRSSVLPDSIDSPNPDPNPNPRDSPDLIASAEVLVMQWRQLLHGKPNPNPNPNPNSNPNLNPTPNPSPGGGGVGLGLGEGEGEGLGSDWFDIAEYAALLEGAYEQTGADNPMEGAYEQTVADNPKPIPTCFPDPNPDPYPNPNPTAWELELWCFTHEQGLINRGKRPPYRTTNSLKGQGHG